MQRAKYNVERLRLYEQLFEKVLAGDQCEIVAANLLVDIRWAEVSRAFVNCLCRKIATGAIRPLATDFGRMVSGAAVLAFGTSKRAAIPSWFLQNNECFLASCLHKLLIEYTRKPPAAPNHMCQAFDTLFDVAKGFKPFLGLEYLAKSTSAHALMSVTAHARYDFLNEKVGTASAPALCFAEMLAERILNEPGRKLELESPFYFFARSERWQKFAKGCVDCFSPDEAFARLQGQVMAQQESKNAPPPLFFLASTFLDADAYTTTSPESHGRRERASTGAPTKQNRQFRSAISKRSAPFVSLVRRLISEA